jgi:Sigma-70 region 2
MESIGCIHDCCLVREVQGGNQAAFQQLVRAYDQAVLRLAFRITGSQSDAQDIDQEAFLKAYNKHHLGSNVEHSKVRTTTTRHGSDLGYRARSGFAEDSAAAFLLGRIRG